MKRPIYLLMALTFAVMIVHAQQRPTCGHSEAMKHLFEEHPDQLDTYLTNRNWITEHAESAFDRAKVVYQIPVVVHVVYSHESVNISNEQIRSQINVLNTDFRAQNSDIGNVPATFSGLTADVEIEFCLASFDPNGNFTNGITRTITTNPQFSQNSSVMTSASGGKDPWDTDTYMNIWVTNLGNQILGFAYPIGTQYEGVVIDYRKFGKGSQYNLEAPYNQGRTATHEVGHYFDLLHLWGNGPDNTNCTISDEVNDTPMQEGSNFGCPSHPSPSCSNGGDLFMNFMDYVDDACMIMFTQGQKARMRAAIEGPGSGLISDQPYPCDFTSISETELADHVSVFPNPSAGIFTVTLENELTTNLIQVINSVGKVVLQKNNLRGIETIDISNQGRGIYLLSVGTDRGRVVKKVVIQ